MEFMDVTFDLHSFRRIKVEENIQIYFKGAPTYNGTLVDAGSPLFKDIFDKISEGFSNLMADIVRNILGSYCIVIEDKDNFILISDLIRSYPLFYYVHDNKVVISDSFKFFLNSELDLANISSFITSGYIYGAATIYNKVNSIQAAEIIKIEKNE